jgi:hypothetical protein
MRCRQDLLRLLEEIGVDAASHPALNRRLPIYARVSWCRGLAAVCAAHAALGPASLVLYAISTLYFETDDSDGFRSRGFPGTPSRAADTRGAADRRGQGPR